ncbi:MAG: SynChlorMet cassette protein ScmD [Chlorobium sp.]|nr:MAG: SynChlorMet cassette protein ScmD [Chlorobium sp.]
MKYTSILNPDLVLREEFDDWAVLFDPDSGDAFALNPVGVFIVKRLDGKHSTAEIAEELAPVCVNMPPDAETFINTFIDSLIEKGYAGYPV